MTESLSKTPDFSGEEMNLEDAEIQRVSDLMDEIEPIVQKELIKIINDEGYTVALSVCSNTATSLMAMSLVMVSRSGGDVNAFIRVLLDEIKGKYDHTRKALLESADLIAALSEANGQNSETRH
jgi:recombinational DNA repair protein (RecF pathway)